MKETRFKQTDIGLVPEDWKVTTLGASCDVNPSNKELPKRFLYLDLESVDSGRIIKNQYVNKKDAPSRAQRLTYQGDILYQLVRPYQKNNLYNAMTEVAVASTGYAVLRQTNTFNKFLYYLLHQDSFTKQVLDRCTGTSYPAITPSFLAEIPIAIPNTFGEQLRIAEVLGRVDELLVRLDKLITKKKVVKKGTMQQLLTGRTRLDGFSEPWKEQTYGELFVSIGNNTFSREMLTSRGNVLNVHYGDILIKFDSAIDVSRCELPYIKKEIRNRTYYPLQNGDIIMADTAEDELVGKVCEIEGISNESVEAGLHTIALRPNIKFAPFYLGYYMNTAHYHNQLVPLIQGTKVCSLTNTTIKNTVILYPTSLAEQRAISRILTHMDKEIEALQAERRKVEQVKKGMMQQLLTGKIRLSV